MKNSTYLQRLLLCLLFAIPLKNATSQTEIVLRFYDHVPQDTIDSLQQYFHATELEITPISNIRLWQLDSVVMLRGTEHFIVDVDTLTIQEVGERARRKVKIQSASPNYVMGVPPEQDPGPTPNCPAPDFCEPGHSGNVKIALIDTGVDQNHPYLRNVPWVDAYNFINDNSDVTDDHSHGTHVTGIIVQIARQTQAFNISLMPLKTQDAEGKGTIFNVIEAIDHAIDKGANIINMSLGYLSDRISNGTDDERPLGYAIGLAGTHNILVIASAGNDGKDLDNLSKTNYPAAFACPNLISIGATDCEDQMPDYSNFGLTSVDVGARGNIRSTLLNNGWGRKAGTSMAAGVVSGVAGLLATHMTTFDALIVKKYLVNGVDDVDIAVLTEGRINPDTSLQMMLEALSRSEPEASNETEIMDVSSLQMEVYPTPFKDFVQLEWQQPISGRVAIRMLDAMGRTIEQKEVVGETGNNQLTIRPNELLPGMYFITLQHGDQIICHKSVAY